MKNEVNTQAEKKGMEVTYKVGSEEINLTGNMVQNFLANGNSRITPQETMMFLSLCKYQKLNPFVKEAYIIKFGSAPAQIVVSKEAFMKRAESNPNYAGMKAGCIAIGEDDDEPKYRKGAFILPDETLVGGWAEIYRTDREIPTRIELSLKEFNKGQSTWKTMPATMIRKTAIVNALREAFPNDLGSMSTEEDKQSEVTPGPTETQKQPAESVKDLIGNTDDPKPKERAPKTNKTRKPKDVTPKAESKSKTKPEPQEPKRAQPSKTMTDEEAKRVYDEFKDGGIDDDAQDQSEPTKEPNGQTDLFNGK
jgi:phage recombination protein Bet